MKQSVYLQIIDDVKRKIDLGLYKQGERLLSCRELAVKMGINPNTVQRAYTALEEEGYIYTIQKKGVYVAARDKVDYSLRIAREKLLELKSAGISRQALTSIIDELYGEEA